MILLGGMMALSDCLRDYEVKDDSLPLTRIMSLSKFTDLLESEALYFSPASEFIDKLEGNYTNLNHHKSKKQLSTWGFDETALQMAQNAENMTSTHSQQAVVISCWTMATEISHEMWDAYTLSNESLAIHTTVGKLRRTLGEEFLFVPVRYLDFDSAEIPRNHSLEPFFYKQNKYSWEKEVRVVAEMEAGKRVGTARRAPVSLSSFITGLRFHPKATKTFIEDVNKLVKDKIDQWGS